MKRVFVIITAIVLCLSLAACGSISLPRQSEETTESVSREAVVPTPSKTQVRTAFEKAMEVYGWFDLCALECDSADKAELNGATYYRVISDEVTTYDALRTLVYDLFDAKTGDELLKEDSKTPPYIDVAGVLYGQDFARGSDVTKGEYELTVEQESKTCFVCKARVETLELNDGYKEYRRVSGHEDYTYRYERSGNRWVFTDFSLFY